MGDKPGTRLFSGTTEVPTEQTPVQLSTAANAEYGTLEVQIAADPSNVGTLVAVGGKGIGTAVKAKKTLHEFIGIPLEKKQAPIVLRVVSLAEIWVDVEKGKDCVVWTAVQA